jgi:PAS domain S-box-containing protein
MAEKPTYKELERRVQELEKIESKYKSSKEALGDSEGRYRALFNSSFGAIFISEKGICLDQNQTAERMFGYTHTEAVGRPGLEWIAPEDREQVKNNMMSGHENSYQITALRKDGTTFFAEIQAKMINVADRSIRVTTLRDITERKKMEAQLYQALKMESVGRLAGGVAHDFNNMLGVILGHTELALLQADENHELHGDLTEIQKAAKRSADITKQLLAFARKQTISPRQLDLNDTVASMLNMLRRLIGEDIDLVWKPAAHLWPVKMDPSQIDQILANLCVNARDAISGVGKLTIETGKKTFDEEYCNEHPGFIPGDFVLLAVSDNGCGMDKDTLDNLFEPFFTTKDVGKGTGLGLATVYGIVKQNAGFINVYSEPGQGSTFRIYLPRLVAEENADKAVPEKKAVAGGTETILLVEDELSILRMTRMMLERKGYSVLPAATPGEAIDLAKTHADKIHLLMSDVVMPEMNGRALAGQITAIYPGIGLLFMSGYTSNVIAHHGVLDVGVAFIQKPFSMEDMTAKVRDVLDTAPDKNQG